MPSHRRRHRDTLSPPPSRSSHKRHRSPSPSSGRQRDRDRDLQGDGGKRPSFPSYLDAPDLPPKIRLLCEILAKTPSISVEAALDDAGVRVNPEDVEEVLKLSYAYPGTAVKFFRWAGAQIQHRHSPYAWNLVIDLLGKNGLFDAMWDAVKTMRSEGTLSLATFASIFSSYIAASRYDEAFMAFEVMDQYNVPRDAAAINSLLSAICRLGQTPRGCNFLARVKQSIQPDSDSYAILLEGWENEGDPRGALGTFSEMVDQIGWDPVNIPAYDSFLSTIARAPGGAKESLVHLDIMRSKRCYPGMKFFRVALEEALKVKDAASASIIWSVMAGPGGCRPDTEMYNNMISLHCFVNDTDAAFQFLEQMTLCGVFPDNDTYSLMLQSLLKGRKYRDAGVIFREMVKNEFLPSEENCKAAYRAFMDTGDFDMVMAVWKCMVKNKIEPLEDIGNSMVLKLRDTDMLPEACKWAEYMAEAGIKVHSSTLSKLKTNLMKLGKSSLYDQILRKWKSH